MVCFVPSICLSIRKSCQRCDCSELGTVRNWVDHCNLPFILLEDIDCTCISILFSSILDFAVLLD